MSLSIDFISRECKNKTHFLCSHKWEGFGFQIVCNCECHKKLVLGKDEEFPNTIDSPLKRNGEYVYINKIPKDKDFFQQIGFENTNSLMINRDKINSLDAISKEKEKYNQIIRNYILKLNDEDFWIYHENIGDNLEVVLED